MAYLSPSEEISLRTERKQGRKRTCSLLVRLSNEAKQIPFHDIDDKEEIERRFIL
jgi:hypothetical protein